MRSKVCLKMVFRQMGSSFRGIFVSKRRRDMIRTVIVDDDFLVRSYLKQLGAWERADYQIAADARDGEEALNIIEKLGPDVVVTDISMPLMDGIELIRRIREQNQAVYIIVLSCHDDFEYVKEAMKLGADEYVLKNSLNEESLYEILTHTAKLLADRKEKFLENDEDGKAVAEISFLQWASCRQLLLRRA